MSDTQPKLAMRTLSEVITRKHKVMFDSDIEASSEYHEQFYVMEQAGKGELVEVDISSLGGSVTTISKFQDIIKNSEATFHGKLHGYGYSAGGALFLLCDTQEVTDLATFMAHSIQTGYGGGTQAIEAHSKMSSEHNEVLCRMLYKDFLTEAEILRICDGAEIWMAADEIRERLAKRDAIREEEAAKALRKECPPSMYAEKLYKDLVEDCNYVDYDMVEILELVKGMHLESISAVPSEESTEQAVPAPEPETVVVEEVEADAPLAIAYLDMPISEGCYLSKFEIHADHLVDGDGEFESIYTIDATSNYYQSVADILNIKYAHNISNIKLCERIHVRIQELREENGLTAAQ